jgi:hypothetical protein
MERRFGRGWTSEVRELLHSYIQRLEVNESNRRADE